MRQQCILANTCKYASFSISWDCFCVVLVALSLYRVFSFAGFSYFSLPCASQVPSAEPRDPRVEVSDSSANVLPPGCDYAAPDIDRTRRYDLCAVGAGLSGTVFAERAANLLGSRVLVLDSRPHIGGNCYDFVDQKTGILRNQYGSHLFHTDIERVWRYVTGNPAAPPWDKWYHMKYGLINGTYVPIPANIMTVNRLFGTDIQTEKEMEAWLGSVQVPCPKSGCRNGEEMAKSRVGDALYKAIFEGYTFKQWGKYPREMDASVTARIPVRPNFDPRYFADKWQALPREGYTSWFEAMLKHPKIDVVLGVDFFDHRAHLESACDRIVYTGPIDRYFEAAGMEKLEYRSINFTEFRHYNVAGSGFVLPTPVVNYPGLETPYTRAVEYKHYLHRPSPHSIVVKETTNDEGEPYYPVPTTRNRKLYDRYKQLAEEIEATGKVIFVGRMANYKYFNMDQAIDNALEIFDRTIAQKHDAASISSVKNKVESRSMLLYILSSRNEYQLQKVKDMALAFGEDFLLIWDNKNDPLCPEEYSGLTGCIDAWKWADSKRGITEKSCCGIQKAVAWATDNRHTFDYAWFMEEDVHYTNIALLQQVVLNTRGAYTATADLVLQHSLSPLSRQFYVNRTDDQLDQLFGQHNWDRKHVSNWGSGKRARKYQLALRTYFGRDMAEHQSHVMMNLFRLSPSFLAKTEEYFHANQDQWAFFETYFPTLASAHHLDVSVWSRLPDAKGEWMRWKPCWTEFPQEGIYHPAKWNGEKLQFKNCKK